MNIKKFISVAGYTMLQPVSFLCKMQKSKMTTEEAHRILASVYAIDKDDLDFANKHIKCFIYLSLCFISKETLILWRYCTINNLKTVGIFKLKLYFCSQKISIYMETSL